LAKNNLKGKENGKGKGETGEKQTILNYSREYKRKIYYYQEEEEQFIEISFRGEKFERVVNVEEVAKRADFKSFRFVMNDNNDDDLIVMTVDCINVDCINVASAGGSNLKILINFFQKTATILERNYFA
jgi:hypothetical protein